jgi:hypothetical protein
LGKVAHLVWDLLEGRTSADRVYWRGQYLPFTKGTNENGVLQRHALYALNALQDRTALAEVADLSEADDLHSGPHTEVSLFERV